MKIQAQAKAYNALAIENLEITETWRLYTYGASNKEGSGVGLIPKSPDG